MPTFKIDLLVHNNHSNLCVLVEDSQFDYFVVKKPTLDWGIHAFSFVNLVCIREKLKNH